jgi:acetylornithine deacetylase
MDAEEAALAALDADGLARDAAALVRVPSLTGQEREVLERLAELAQARGLATELSAHDLAALRAHPEQPGEEAPREELLGLTATLRGRRPGRLALNGHLDVVGAGSEPWCHGPWSGRVEEGWLHGRGAADMKGGVAAALHALAAIRAARAEDEVPEVVLQGVASEEDGGLGTFAALERDAAFDAALIPEPTGFQIVCAQAGALTFRGEVRGRAAHAAVRLEGVSAVDRYLPVHAALQAHEARLNEGVAHPLMRALALPYPVSVGRLEAGEWSSSVPDRLVFEGRLGVRVGERPQDARAALEAALGEDVALSWTGGAFASGETPPDHPWIALLQACAERELGRPVPLAGAPYGADLRLFTARGIPCAMFGPGGLERAHGVDERVRVDDLVAVARTIIRVLVRWRR